MKAIPHVAVIGTGRMGSALAGRLLDTGFEVGVWSPNPRSMMALVDRGATAFAEVSDCTEEADVVISSLPDAEATSRLLIDGSTLDSLRHGAIWVQMAAIGIDATERLGAQILVRRSDMTFVDAPVSGTRDQAAAGRLLILAAGPADADVQLALKPVFQALGRETIWVGPVGAGSRMELICNIWLASHAEPAPRHTAGQFGRSRLALRPREVESVGVGPR